MKKREDDYKRLIGKLSSANDISKKTLRSCESYLLIIIEKLICAFALASTKHAKAFAGAINEVQVFVHRKKRLLDLFFKSASGVSFCLPVVLLSNLEDRIWACRQLTPLNA